MKQILIFIFFFLFANFNAQTKPFNLVEIENSKEYELNIKTLEAELKNHHTNNDTLLKMQIALINNYANISQFNKATAFCQKEILAAQKNKLTLNEASLYLALARVYYFLKQSDKFLFYNIECLKIAEKYQYYELLKKCNHNLGVLAFENEQNYEKAEKYFWKAIEFGKKIPPTKQNNLGRNYRLLATLYDTQNKFKQADSVFKITTEIYKSFQDSFGLAEAYTFHARLFMSMNLLDKALALSKESIAISKALKNDDYLITALSMLVQIDQKMGNYKDAYLTQSEIITISTRMYSENQKKEIADSEAKFKVAELKNQQGLSEIQAKQTKRNYIFISLFLFLISIASIVMIYQKRLAKKEQALKLKNLSDVYDAEEKERIRIAKDLHDNMGAYATSILAQIDMLELTPQQPGAERLKDLRNDAEFIMSTLRETIWILKTKNITTIQFFDLLKIYTDKHLVKNLGIKVIYNEEHVSDKLFSPTVSLNLYRIVQEIIQNIIKHAQAKTVTFKLTSDNTTCIEIHDDGIGFDIASLKRKSGLDNMQFRAKEINFNIIISSEINKGTRIVLEEIL